MPYAWPWLARRLAGANPHGDEAIAALRQAAAESRATLTPHATAMGRAGGAAQRLDEYMSSLRVDRRAARIQPRVQTAATARRLLTFKTAEARLRTALIPLLMNAGKPTVGASLFAQVFGVK
jgi:hypothetical protein